jgi:hypothetical protein
MTHGGTMKKLQQYIYIYITDRCKRLISDDRINLVQNNNIILF